VVATVALACLGLAVSVGDAFAQTASHKRPYEGIWGVAVAACKDVERVEQMIIEGNSFQWYETRCRARKVDAASPEGGWTLRMSCEGEGQRFTATPRLSLPDPNKLIIDHSPVGPDTHQVYVRCNR
jgi:hypothetical protein